jgi:membrane-associated phospholipid phosphatase
LGAPHEIASQRLYAASAAFAALTLPAMLLDLHVIQFVANGWLPGDLRRIFSWAEVVAHGLGVAIIAITVLVLDSSHRRHVPRMLAAAYLAGLFANIGKMLVARVRPRFFKGEAITESFVGWLPIVFEPSGKFEFGFKIQSFPSGHTATAVGMAVGLSLVYPRGSWLFFTFAALAAAQRIDVNAHYLSDTTAAAAVAFLAAALIADARRLGRWFDRIEGHP